MFLGICPMVYEFMYASHACRSIYIFWQSSSEGFIFFKQRAAFLPLLFKPYSKGPLIPNPMREGQCNHNIAPIQLLYLLLVTQSK